MSGYTVEIRTGILTGDHNLHTWLRITKPDGTKDAWGFYPATDSLGNILYGPGDVRQENPIADYTATSGPLSMTEAQYQALMDNIAAMDAAPPDYSLISLPGGIQCSMWAVETLQGIGLVPSVISPGITPELIPLFDSLIWNPLWQSIGFNIYDFVSSLFTSAQTFVPRRDPLTFDLDSDGLETIGINTNNPILFDHDGDGVKTATGWVAPDDGFLVLDRNGNGEIDNGTELFGDSTPLMDSEGNVVGNAEDGFAALAQEDTNSDGVVDSNDVNFQNLRVWRDLNQDGMSQAEELKTLEEAGIASISVTKTENSKLLPNGNVIADLGTYTKTDGTTGGLGTTAQLGDVDLNENTFYSEFIDTIPLTDEAALLPDMNGSGQVRDLREAASLSPALASALTAYAQATTRAEQLALLDNLIKAWSDTSLMLTTATGAYDGHPLTITLQGVTAGTPQYQAWLDKITIMEHFNGRTFRQAPTGTDPVTVTFFSGSLSLLDQSYAALKSSIYDGLLLQTRLKPYIDDVGMTIDAAGNAALDFTGTAQVFQSRHDIAPGEAVRDLLDLQRIAGTNLIGMGWDGYGQLRGWLAEVMTTTDPTLQPTLIAALSDFGYSGLRTQGDGTGSSEVIIGADTGAVLNGNAGNDLVLGGDGNDTLNGGTGNDILYGGAGNDTYILNPVDGADTIIETHGTEGNDTIEFGSGILAGDITITQDGDKLVFSHSNGRDKISIANWFDSLADSAHRLDTVRFADGSSFDLNALQLGTANADTLTGTTANDILIGNAGDDVLTGDSGNDWMDGGSGADQMLGGAGNDIYVVDNSGDVVTEAADEGTDIVDSKITYTLGDNIENLRLVGTGSISGSGNSLDNTITGNDGNNTLQGMDGNDTLIGNAGNDTLDGGSGADVMTGGTGDDSYVVDTLADTVTELANQGTDTVSTNLTYTLGANVENLNLTGTTSIAGTGNELNNVLTGNSGANTLTGLGGNDTLYGNTGNDTLDGGAGNDWLDGGAGADTMLGGTGNDTYIVDNVGDIVTENINEGTDSVQSSITYTLTDNVENLTLTGSANIAGTGNVLDNVITGNSGSNNLTGLEGNDTLDGGAGADTMLGGTGNDTYVVDNIGDVVTENAGEGNDTVQSGISYSLGEDVENLTLTGSAITGTGNELDNNIIGNNANNTLDGGLGVDAMAGSYGNDTYILDNTGDTVTEQAGQGTDTVISPFDYTLGSNVENLTLTGAALNGTGNTLDNAITGTAADNTLTGLDGNDTLNGGEGADTLVGGRGNDTYVVDNLLDTTTELAGEGIDTVQSSLTWTLAENLDNLTLTSTANIDGTGNNLNNTITGNSGNNTLTGLEGDDTLDGKAGVDVMLGGVGNDTYIVDNTGDAVIENANEGTDTVQSSITYTLTDNVENLTLTGTANIAGTGNVLNNVITGNTGANTLYGLEGSDTLNGGVGSDTMIGGVGSDTYIVDNAGDTVIENPDEGTDTLQSSVSHTLSANVENLTLTGSASINGTGNELNNVITGNTGNNVLSGLAGNDTLTGNSGNDTLDGGLGADIMTGNTGDDTYIVDNAGDIVTENANEGTDTVQSSITYTLTNNVENLTLTGTSDVNGTGNVLNNVITGNSGDNALYGMDGNDTLNGNSGNDLLDGGTGVDTMTGGAGDDTYVVDNEGDIVTENTDEGTDTVQSSISYTLGDTVENLTLIGSNAIDGTGNALDNAIIGNDGNNQLLGLEGNDTLNGNGGNDLLDGSTGADVMAGGTGDDTYIVDDAGDVVAENLEAGSDTVQSSITYTLTNNVENLNLTGAGDLNGTGNALDNAITGTSGNNTLDGGAGMDTLTGGAGNDTYIVDNTGDVVVEGLNAGTDTVLTSDTYTLSDNIENITLTGSSDIAGTGNALANTITANSGLNVMAGMAGNDTYIVDNTSDVVVENLNEGTDLVQSSATYTLSANVENLTLTGTANSDGTGNNLNNTITGNSGNNIIDGGAGSDSMSGGTGDDTYIVDNTGDTVAESLNAGVDTIYSSVTYTLSANVENLTLTGAANSDATGNELNNILVGNIGNNRLYGMAGNDSLTGNQGNDLLDGGTGTDIMAGNAGNDTYVVDNTGDMVTENADEGIDTVQSSINYALGANVENLTLTGTAAINATGNALNNVIIGNTNNNVLSGLAGNDTLTGNSGNDTLDGGLDADTMAGGAGNDTYIVDNVGDLITENLNEGTDIVQSSVTYTLSDNIENLTLTGTGDINGTGNALANTITANSGLNVLAGMGGNDTYIVDNTSDVVVENLNEGTDLVQSSATYTLSANVENLTLTGTANIDGTGNNLNNTITGNSGNNVLDGSSGADSMSGGTGNDTYIVDNSGDVVTEATNAGTDIVYSSVTYTLTSNVENLTLTGSGNINGTGNTLNNIIIGNTGNNTLDGSTGADTMLGGIGNDTYIVDNTGDIVTENMDEGTDIVQSSVSYTLSANVENLTLTGTAAINGTGNDLNNIIIGNTGNNVLSGLAGNDTLTGNAGNDTLNGGVGADTMTGNAGDDTYVVDDAGDLVTENLNEGTDLVQSSITYTLTSNVENLTLTGIENINGTGNTLNNIITGNTGSNILDGGAGNDTINAGAGNDTLIGGDGNDALNGEAGIDIITGNAGNDTLNGGLGADTMTGNAGDDTYVVDDAGDIVTENANEGTDLVQSSITYTLTDNVENLTLTGTANIAGTGNVLNNVITGNSGANTLYGLEGNDTLDGSTGADTMLGGIGNDTYIVDNTGDIVTENMDEGTDIVQSSVSYTLSANVENLTLTGTANINGTGNDLNNIIIGNTGNNVLSGLTGNDTLTGNAGNDTLNGGVGADTMTGNAGDDTYVVDDAGDLVTENLNEGTDLVQSSITYTLTSNVENLTLTGIENINGTGNTLNNVITGNTGSNILDGGAGADTINAGAGDDILIGGDGNDALNGEAGIDIISGNAGNDTLNGGLGADTMTGNTGDDTYVVDDAGDIVTENANEGTDLVQSSITYTLTDNVENLTLTGSANINGTGNVLNNVITGNSGANTLYGLEGNDTLDGSTGADTMLGGIGNDTYIVDNTGDVVTENIDEGTDTVQSSVTYTLSANVENLTLTGTAAINGTGNALNNVIAGNTGNNVLSGLAGNDTLTGNSGNDTLDGGLDVDTMTGNAGNDTYVVDNAGDLVTEALNEGTDLVQSSITYTLTNNVENLTLTGTADIAGTGNTLNNTITGNSGANVIDGGAGADTMIGGAGNDTYIVDNTSDVITESAGGGTDSVLSSATYTLSANIENLTLTGSTNINGTGNTLNNIITGNTGANTLNGDAGNDIIDGGSGADTMLGGAGDDTYIVESSGDVVTEAANAGTDTVQSSISYTLTTNVENLTLTGIASINGTGNALNNTITGTSGNNTLDGSTGADTMLGGIGNDTYIVDNTGDVVTENADEGTDLVQSSISYTLSDNVENLTLTGTGSINGTGNALNNVITGNTGNNVLSGLAGNDTITGNSGNDTLDGGLGADTMSGGVGNDTYVVDDSGDAVTENANEGTDTVQSSINYALGANVENLTLTGTANINGAGNDLNNIITGNSGDNVLDGGAGADTLTGGQGNDTYLIDNDSDTVIEQEDEGIDTVQSYISYILGNNMENLILTGVAIAGIGNSIDNTLIGNASGNILDGGLGADTMSGGAGDDTYIVDNTGDIVTENPDEGTDLVQSSITYTLTNNVENLTLTGTANIDGTGNTLNNIITGNSGANVIDGGTGADTMIGGTGADTYIVDDSGDAVTENADEGTDTVQSGVSYTLTANVENLTLTGVDNLNGTGNALDNVITGNSGNNVLNGGAGSDTMIGGAGDDIYVVDSTNDIVAENANEGSDIVQSSATYTLSDNVENLTLTGTDSINGTGNALDNVIIGNSGLNTLMGLGGNDTYIVDNTNDLVLENANEGSDIVQTSATYTLSDNVENLTLTGTDSINGTGNALDNTITGNSGVNVLDGGAGSDAMMGGAGNDTYVVDNVGDVVTENADEGTDTVQSAIDYALGNNVENLTLTGIASINGTGNELNNVITGNSGNNVLNGGAGSDTMIGGAGDDIYVVDSTNDIVAENANEGSDIVQSSATYTLSDNVENLTLTGTDSINGTGNALDNVIIGNSGLNTLMGLGGNDTYIVDNTNDLVLENANEGSDIVQTSATYTLSDNVENLTLTGTDSINGTGNALDNIITGNIGNNILDGGEGADTMIGGAGNDTYIIDNLGDTITENANEGTDTVNSGIAYTLGANLENLTLAGTDNINASGNELNNILTGNAGSNILDGKEGPDTMSGRAGNDTYIVDNAGDVVVELAGEGNDTVYSGIDYTLTDNVENLILTGDTAIAGTGNELNNVITGNSAANILNAGLGNDTIAGGKGNDILNGGAGDDVYTYNVDDGLDRISDTSGIDTLSMGDGIDFDHTIIRIEQGVAHLRLLDAEGDETSQGIEITLNPDGSIPVETINFADGTGFNTKDLVIESKTTYGTNKSDVISTGRNEDTIYAYQGEDTVYAGASNDTVYGGNGNDLLYGETGNDKLYGENGNDILDGGGGKDVLYGGNGDDVLIGGKGNDTLYGESGSDTYKFSAGSGQDTISDTGGDTDIAQFDVNPLDLVFARSGNNLDITISSVSSRNDSQQSAITDQLTVQNWYSGATNQIEILKTSDGSRLLNTQVGQLIQAMASFSADNGMTWTEAIQNKPQEVHQLLAQYWEAQK